MEKSAFKVLHYFFLKINFHYIFFLKKTNPSGFGEDKKVSKKEENQSCPSNI